MNIVVTRERASNEQLIKWLPPQASISEVPLTETRYQDLDEVRKKIAAAANGQLFESLVVTSERTQRYLKVAREYVSEDAEVFSVGSSTTKSIELEGLTVRVQVIGRAKDLGNQVSRGPVLLLGARAMRTELRDELVSRSMTTTMVDCYETVSADLSANDIAALKIAHVVVIGAPSGWKVAKDHVSEDTLVVVPGASTGEEVRVTHENVLEAWGPSLRDEVLKRIK